MCVSPQSTKAKKVDFNSESYCQRSCTGGCYVTADLPVLPAYCSQPSQQATVQTEMESWGQLV